MCSRSADSNYRATPYGQARKRAYAQSDLRRSQKAAHYEASKYGRVELPDDILRMIGKLSRTGEVGR